MDLIKLAGSLKKRESSEHLKLLAKRAAGMYISKESDSLTSAVRSSLKNEKLNEDQMRRVVEMANQATWKETFEGDRQVNFEPADANSVVSSFSESPVESAPMSLDYHSDPPSEAPKIDLEKEFGVPSSDEYEKLNPNADAQEEVAKAAAAADTCRHAVDLMKSSIPEVADGFFRNVKHAHVFEGHSITKIAKAVGAVTAPGFSGSVMKTAAKHLHQEGIRFNLDKERASAKESVIINTDHDLIQSAVKLEKVAKALALAQDAHNKSISRHKKAIATLKGR